MKPRNFLLAACIIVLLSGTGAAAFSYSNDITLNFGDASWKYEECVTGREASFSRQLIDMQAGNNDSFVNVWELIGMEREFEERLHRSIEKEPDVRFNNSSEPAKIQDVEYSLSEEALGSVFKRAALRNRARVTYSLDKGALDSGTELWFKGTPESKVKVTLPPGLDVSGSEGVENSTVSFEKERAVLKGRFGEEGEITVRLSENKSYSQKLAQEALNASLAEKKNESVPEKPKPELGPEIFRYFNNLKSKLIRTLDF